MEASTVTEYDEIVCLISLVHNELPFRIVVYQGDKPLRGCNSDGLFVISMASTKAAFPFYSSILLAVCISPRKCSRKAIPISTHNSGLLSDFLRTDQVSVIYNPRNM